MIVSIGWMVVGGVLFLLVIATIVYFLTRDSFGDEDIVESEIREAEEEEVARLEKLEKAYNHFSYADRGISFKDYVRKVDCGTWGELAEQPKAYFFSQKSG